jgi:3-alpha domain
MTVAEVSALLYLPGHTARKLERAMAIPALSEGWRHSFEALLEQDAHSAINESRRNPSAKAADFSGCSSPRRHPTRTSNNLPTRPGQPTHPVRTERPPHR